MTLSFEKTERLERYHIFSVILVSMPGSFKPRKSARYYLGSMLVRLQSERGRYGDGNNTCHYAEFGVRRPSLSKVTDVS